jgi:anti-sigma-K factor RskA
MSDTDAMSDTHDCGAEAAAYALGALEPAEADAFRRHLEECAVCRDEVDALRGVVEALPMAAPQVQPPRRLRRRVLRAASSEPRPGTAAIRRRSPLTRIPRPAVAALGAAVLAAGAAVAGVELSRGGPHGRIIRAQVTGISGSAELRLSHGRGELIVRDLTPPPPGHVYEVWLKAPGSNPVPASVLFSVNSGGGADVGLPSQLRGISAVLVTPEPRGGSPVPTHAPVIVASLT